MLDLQQGAAHNLGQTHRSPTTPEHDEELSDYAPLANAADSHCDTALQHADRFLLSCIGAVN